MRFARFLSCEPAAQARRHRLGARPIEFMAGSRWFHRKLIEAGEWLHLVTGRHTRRYSESALDLLRRRWRLLRLGTGSGVELSISLNRLGVETMNDALLATCKHLLGKRPITLGLFSALIVLG